MEGKVGWARPGRCALGTGLVLTLLLMFNVSSASTSQSGKTKRLTVNSSGIEADGNSFGAHVSADGRFVAFSSEAMNLVEGDTNGHRDVFVAHVATGEISRVSVASDGTEANGVSGGARISSDGRYVAISSMASNLVPGDTNGRMDIFVRDSQNNTTIRVEPVPGGEPNSHLILHDLSADGRFVLFASLASNLTPGDTNGVVDHFRFDRQTGETVRVSIGVNGQQGNWHSQSGTMSADGRFVAFHSDASNLFSGDSNGWGDIYVRDLVAKTTTLASVNNEGQQANSYVFTPAISADGRFVAFSSPASNLVPGATDGAENVFVRDLISGTTERVSISWGGEAARDGASMAPAISADGRFVVFRSAMRNFYPGKIGATGEERYLRDRLRGTTELLTVNPAGIPAFMPDTWCYPFGECGDHTSSISSDGRYIAFSSELADLVLDDNNRWRDVFVRDRFARCVIPCANANSKRTQ